MSHGSTSERFTARVNCCQGQYPFFAPCSIPSPYLFHQMPSDYSVPLNSQFTIELARLGWRQINGSFPSPMDNLATDNSDFVLFSLQTMTLTCAGCFRPFLYTGFTFHGQRAKNELCRKVFLAVSAERLQDEIPDIGGNRHPLRLDTALNKMDSSRIPGDHTGPYQLFIGRGHISSPTDAR
jgi:hypothetical protein